MHRTSPPNLHIPNRKLKILLLIHGWLNPQLQNLWVERGLTVFVEKNHVYK